MKHTTHTSLTAPVIIIASLGVCDVASAQNPGELTPERHVGEALTMGSAGFLGGRLAGVTTEALVGLSLASTGPSLEERILMTTGAMFAYEFSRPATVRTQDTSMPMMLNVGFTY